MNPMAIVQVTMLGVRVVGSVVAPHIIRYYLGVEKPLVTGWLGNLDYVGWELEDGDRLEATMRPSLDKVKATLDDKEYFFITALLQENSLRDLYSTGESPLKTTDNDLYTMKLRYNRKNRSISCVIAVNFIETKHNKISERMNEEVAIMITILGSKKVMQIKKNNTFQMTNDANSEVSICLFEGLDFEDLWSKVKQEGLIYTDYMAMNLSGINEELRIAASLKIKSQA